MPARLPQFQGFNAAPPVLQGQQINQNQLAQMMREQQFADQNQLRQALPGAVSGDQQALQTVAGISPQAGMQAGKFNQQQSQQEQIAFIRMNKQALHLLKGVDDQISYEDALDMAEDLGGFNPELLQQLKDTPYSPQIVETLKARVSGNLEGVVKPLGAPRKTTAGGLVQPVQDELGDISSVSVPLDGKLVTETPEQKLKLFRDKEKIKTEEAAKRETTKNLNKVRTKISAEISHNAREASRQIPRMQRIIKALRLVDTGKMAEAKRILGPFIPGVDPTNEQALNAELNEVVFDIISRFKGALSDGERLFAKETSTSLGKTKAANIKILQRLIQRSQDSLDEFKQFKKFRAQGGKPEDFTIDVPNPSGHKVGDVVTTKSGARVRIINLTPDGDPEVEEIQ